MGRRSKKDEWLIQSCLNKTWKQFEKWIEDETIPLNERVKAAIPLMSKSMPQHVRKSVDTVVHYISSIPRPALSDDTGEIIDITPNKDKDIDSAEAK